MRSFLSLSLLACLLPGCGNDSLNCTDEQRTAIIVQVSGAEPNEVERVSVERSGEADCEASMRDVKYTCYEHGSKGPYSVRVHTADGVLTKTVHVPEDGCELETQTVTFDLDAD